MLAPDLTASVLAILPFAEDQVALKHISMRSKWNLGVVEALGRAAPLIDELSAGIVITDSQLPDGCWQDVLDQLRGRRVEPMLIVASRLADDRLWAEVLNLGGYDVLTTPLQPREVVRSVGLAWRQWEEKLASSNHVVDKVMVAGSSEWLKEQDRGRRC
ncbi:MAG: hypothetical protein ABSH50_05725 [Bryobacteraceae bacterium]|jgi:DNA-binding response OmpR family regulator